MIGRLTRGEEGMTLIEVMVAILVLTVGILASFRALVPAQNFSRSSDFLTVESSIAEKELERIKALGYTSIWLSDTPATSSDPNNPGYYVRGTTPPGLQWDRENSSAVEPLCIGASSCGGGGLGSGLSSMTTWSVPSPSGAKTGKIYRYVTVVDDSCGNSPGFCSTTTDYKRVTLMVTHDGRGAPIMPFLISTLIADPNAYRTG